MASKKSKATHESSSKLKRKTSSSKGKSTTSAFDENLFMSLEHAERYQNIKKRKVVPDRKILIERDDVKEVRENIERRKWQKFCNTAGLGYESITKEFYANAYHDKESLPTYKTFVRGKEVHFNAKAINELLDTTRETLPFPSAHDELTDTQIDPQILCKPGRGWILDGKGKFKCLKVPDLQPIPRAWYAFIMSNFLPMFHGTEIITERVRLLYAIMTDMEIDVGNVIAKEMDNMAVSPIKSFGFPSIIAGLCKEAQVDFGEDEAISPNTPVTNMMIAHFKYTDSTEQREGGSSQTQGPHPFLQLSRDQQLLLLINRQQTIQKNLQSIHVGVTQGFQVLEGLMRKIGHQLRISDDEMGNVLLTDSQLAAMIDFEELPNEGMKFGEDKMEED